MRSVRMILRTEFRRRRLAWLALALLVAVISGTVLAGVSAAQRTASAFPDFVARDGYDAAVISSDSFARHLTVVHGVESSTILRYYGNGNINVGGHGVPSADVTVTSLPVTHVASSMHLISGTMPEGARDVVVGYSMAQRFGLHPGSTLLVPFVARSKIPPGISGSPAKISFRVLLHVVGVVATVVDFPSTSPSYSIYASRAFDRAYGTRTSSITITFARLVRGASGMLAFQSAVNHLNVPGLYFSLDVDATTGAIEGSIHPQVIGWWLFALFGALAGLALVGQALSRQSLIESDDFLTLETLGLRPVQLFAIGMLRSALIGGAGALGGLGLALLLSPLTPVGEARAAELNSGFALSGSLAIVGVVAILGAVMALSAWPAWRSVRQHNDARRTIVVPRSRVASVVGAMGAPPSTLIGVRHGLERGRGRTSTPVVTALVGTTLAIAAVVITSIFGASFSHLVSTPRLYGDNWQVDLDNLTYPQVQAIAKSLRANPNVTKITYGVTGKYIEVNGYAVETLLVDDVKGPLPFSLATGRDPRGDRQMLVGTTTLSAAHAHVGSRVTVSIVNAKGKKSTGTLLVAGTVVIPPSFQIGGLGDGAVMTIRAAEGVACINASPRAPCVATVQATLAHTSMGMAVATANTSEGRATATRLDEKYASQLTAPAAPTSLVNFGQAVDFPLLLALTLALFGAAMLTHLLVVIVTRRRREFAVLRVLGFTRRQVSSSIFWQSTTTALIGVVFGVPLGLLGGVVIWRDFVTSLGAVPATVIPGITIAVIALLALVCALALAVVPAILTARIVPGEALREG